MKRIELVDIKFGYSCNNNCVHCVIAGHREKLIKEEKSIDRTTEEIKNHLRQAKELEADSVVFTGGEATIRKDFFELLEFAKSLGLKVSLQTNGRMFSSKEFAKKTLSLDPGMHFEIAIHSHKKETHDSITRVNGSFEQTTRGIKNLLKLGVKSLNFKIVISRLNYKDLTDMIKLSENLGVRQVDISFPHGMGNALKYWFEIVPRYSEIESDVVNCAKVAKKLGRKVSFEAIPFCFLNGFEDCVSEVRFLKQYINGLTSQLRQVGDPIIDWQKERLSIKSKATQCQNCKYFYVCEGVWEEYTKNYGNEEFKPVKGKQIKTYGEIKEWLKSIP